MTWLLLFLLLSIPLLEACFIVVMWLKDRNITGTLYVPAYVFYLLAYTYDIFCNLTVVSLLFLEVPKEFTVSSRLQRHVDGKDGFRRNMALWFARKLLNPFSNPPHIRVPM